MIEKFLLGAATAAHQVEGNNIHSDSWALEQMENSSYKEPSLDAVNHYEFFEKDIEISAKAGLNAYRFSIEWARIEPQQGCFDENEIAHYRCVLECCLKNGITPIVTLHHFSSPKWLITQGGWENRNTISYFSRYCTYVVEQLGDVMEYICTINEANMGLQIASIAKDMMSQMVQAPQVGLTIEIPEEYKKRAELEAKVFDLPLGEPVNTFLSVRSIQGDKLIMEAHEAARDSMKKVCLHLKIGITLSLYDVQVQPGGEYLAKKEWDEQFSHYLPYIKNDDFIGVQNYTRKIIGANGTILPKEDAALTQMGYEIYPNSIGNVVKRVWKDSLLPVLITENGIACNDDNQRITFIKKVLENLEKCIKEGIPIKGYLYWSLLDNYEWNEGFSKQFGLIAVDRTSQKRSPKKSLSFLGQYDKNKFI